MMSKKLFLAVGLSLSLSVSVAYAQTKKNLVPRNVQVYKLWGLGGPVFSSGIDRLGEKLSKIPRVKVSPTYSWSQWRVVVDLAKKLPKSTRIVIIGNSMGGNATIQAANALHPRHVSFINPQDPTIWWTMQPIQTNVRSVECVWNTNPLSSIPPVGHARCTLAPKFDKKRFKEVQTRRLHIAVDDAPEIHDAVIKKVKSLTYSKPYAKKKK